MTKYRFFTLLKCFPEVGVPGETSEDRLNQLLEEGWKPVRETPLESAEFPGSQTNLPGSQTTGIAHVFAVLILLERDEE